MTSDKNEIVKILNDQFCEVFNPSVDYNTVYPAQLTINYPCITNASIFSVSNIVRAIKNLDIHKPAGPDGLHPRVIKSCPNSFAIALSHIFKSFFNTGSVPDAWKIAHITPIHKKGNKTEPTNYRPISLTALPCKIMERMIRDEMMNHLIRNELIVDEQHGFVMNKSCLTNLLESLDTITNALDEGNRIILIFLNFAKAFDKVCHKALVAKLETYGFNKQILDWVKDFLHNRKQRVIIGEYKSNW